MLKPVCMSALLAASLVSGQTVEAREGSGPVPAEVVSYGDLDLRSAAGVRTFDRRISQATNRLCGAAYHGVQEMLAIRACRSEAFGSVAEQRARAIAGARTSGIELAARRQ